MITKRNFVKFVISLFLSYVLYIYFFKRKCHLIQPSIYSHLGTKSPYRFVQNLDIEPINYPGCKPTKIWGMVRHGTRKPKIKTYKHAGPQLAHLRKLILDSIAHNKGELCPEVRDLFYAWEMLDVNEKNSQYLTHEGEDEMLLLGERTQYRFPDILPNKYDNSTYKFRYTATQRAQASAEQFAVGLFGKRHSHYVWYPVPSPRDPVLRFYKMCDYWKEKVNKNPKTYTEREKFSQSDEMKKVVEKINRRLGVSIPLSYVDVFYMYETCAYETAIDPYRESPWCYIFDQEDMQAFEYCEDMKYYWRDGYGFAINYNQACQAVNDMVQHFRSTSSSHSAVFYFSHSGTLLKMLCHLGLYKDESPLMANNYKEHLDRQWRVSKIDTFGTNLMFVLFRCGLEDKVLTLHQERPVFIEGCPKNEDLCPLETILSLYSDCRFNEMCSLNQ